MKKAFLILLSIVMIASSFSQNVGIGTNAPDASAALDIHSPDKGLLPPRVSLTGINDVTTIVSPATGLLVYNTANAGAPPNNVAPGYYYYTGSGWLRISNTGGNTGDIQYWNGTQWVNVPSGTTGQSLTMCNGVPIWGLCNSNTVTPTISTNTVTGITATTATGGGNITSNGGAPVTVRGVCYGTSFPPTLADNVVTAASAGSGSFAVPLVNLLPNTIYYTRAFATNSAGTAFGTNAGFSTPGSGLPSITTTAPFAIGNSSASCGGNITDNGGTLLTARGIVYATTPLPTLVNSVVTDVNTATGSYTVSVNNLLANTTYFVRAYASNQQGTVYGNEFSFTALSSGSFTAVYTFDAVSTSSGTTDPTPLPVVASIAFESFVCIGAGSPAFNPTAAGRFSFTGWPMGAVNGSDVFPSTDTLNRYFEVTFSPDPGKTIHLDSLSFRLQRSGTGIRQAFVRSNVDNFLNNLPAAIYPANTFLSVVPTNKFQVSDATTSAQDGCTVILGTGPFTGITSPVTFRIYGIHAEAATGTFSIDNVIIHGQVLP